MTIFLPNTLRGGRNLDGSVFIDYVIEYMDKLRERFSIEEYNLFDKEIMVQVS